MKNLIINALTHFIRDVETRRRVREVLNSKRFGVETLSGGGVAPTQMDALLFYIQQLRCNACFSGYKNAFAGRDVAVVGAGPTLSFYSPLADVIHIGCNRVIQASNVPIDFLFRQDFKGCDTDILDSEIEKFIGIYPDWVMDMCPETTFAKLKNAHQFVINNRSDYIPVDISKQPVWHGGSVAFSAFQFALYGNPRRIYLIGCDSAGQIDSLNWNHFFDDNNERKNHNIVPIPALINGWKKLKQFQEAMYPDVEVVSINPVGLKGLFQDKYLR